MNWIIAISEHKAEYVKHVYQVDTICVGIVDRIYTTNLLGLQLSLNHIPSYREDSVAK